MKKSISLLLLLAMLASLLTSLSSCALFADNGGESESSSEKESASEPIAEENAFTVTLAEYDEAFNTLGEKARAYMNAGNSTSIAKIVEAEAGNIPQSQSEWYQRDTAAFRAYRFDKPLPVTLDFSLGEK